MRLIDHYDVNFDLQGSRLALTPIVLHSLLQIRENYFGWSYFPCTSKEIKAWGGRNLRSRYAARDWLVDESSNAGPNLPSLKSENIGEQRMKMDFAKIQRTGDFESQR